MAEIKSCMWQWSGKRREFERFIKGKNVALVGPSESLIGRGLGPFIDAFDIVARINRPIRISPELENDYGSKHTVLYGHFHPNIIRMTPEYVKNIGFEWAVCPFLMAERMVPCGVHRWSTAYLSGMAKMYDGIMKFCIGSPRTQAYIMEKGGIKKRPNTGFMAIYDILFSGARCLFVAGMDFYRKSYVPIYSKMSHKDLTAGIRNAGIHSPSEQMAFLKKHLNDFPNLICDHFLMKILIKDPSGIVK